MAKKNETQNLIKEKNKRRQEIKEKLSKEDSELTIEEKAKLQEELQNLGTKITQLKKKLKKHRKEKK